MTPRWTEAMIADVNQAHVVNHIGLLFALLAKGVITSEDYDRGKMQATHVVDQVFAEKQEVLT